MFNLRSRMWVGWGFSLLISKFGYSIGYQRPMAAKLGRLLFRQKQNLYHSENWVCVAFLEHQQWQCKGVERFSSFYWSFSLKKWFRTFVMLVQSCLDRTTWRNYYMLFFGPVFGRLLTHSIRLYCTWKGRASLNQWTASWSIEIPRWQYSIWNVRCSPLKASLDREWRLHEHQINLFSNLPKKLCLFVLLVRYEESNISDSMLWTIWSNRKSEAREEKMHNSGLVFTPCV